LSTRLTNTPLPVASGSRSTTPTYEPGGPPPISPALPPLDLGHGNVSSVDMGEKEKRSTGEGKFPSPTSLCVFQRRISRIQDQEQEVDKVILNTTNLRYIILSLNTIHCSQFPTKTKTKHASLRCTIHLLYIYIGQVGARCIFVPGFWILASRGSCSHIQFGA
jgi:hypothetical protein